MGYRQFNQQSIAPEHISWPKNICVNLQSGINDCYLHFKNVSCAGTFQLCEWDWHVEVEEWMSKPLLPCWDMCRDYVIACTNDENEVDKMCNDSTKFKKGAPCTGWPYTEEKECDSASTLSISSLLILAVSYMAITLSNSL